MNFIAGMLLVWCWVALGVNDGAAAEMLTRASPPSQLEQAFKDLSSDEEATREQAIRALIEQGDATWFPRLDELRANADRSLRMAIKPVADAWKHRVNLTSPDADTRRSAAADLGSSGRTAALPWLETAAATESHRWVRYAMDESAQLLRLASEDPTAKTLAATKLGEMRSQNAVPALKELVQAASEPNGTEQQQTVARAAAAAIDQIETWNVWSTAIETVFRGISLSSILLIMSVGLAIVFGLMGVINMAHGELMMIGAYATYVMQECFKLYVPPAWFDAYYLAAFPASFLAAALFGLLLEATVIRFLYGRPLETIFQCLRHLRVEHELADVQECLLVPFPMARFDLAKALRWADLLDGALLDFGLRDGFGALERISKSYRGYDYPIGAYDEEPLLDVHGSFQLTFGVPRPGDNATGGLVPEAWTDYVGLLRGGPTASDLFNSHFLGIPLALRHAVFLEKMFPDMQRRFVDAIRLEFVFSDGSTFQPAHADFTLAGANRAGKSTTVTFRSQVTSNRRRKDITYVRLKLDPKITVLPLGLQSTVAGLTIHYASRFLSHPLVSGASSPDDLLPADPVMIPTPSDAYEGGILGRRSERGRRSS